MNSTLLNKFSLVHLAIVAAVALMMSNPIYASSEHIHEPEHSHELEHTDKHHDDHGDSHGHNDDHNDEHGDEHGHDEHEEGQIHIGAEQIVASGIVTQTARAGDIKQTLTVYGRAVVPEAASSQVRARFAGLITSININVGDRVKAGQVLAEVESNSSLKRYSIKAPISGMVVSRSANAGEMASDNVLLSIIDDSQLWAEYQVFPGQLSKVAVGQELSIASEQQAVTSTISHLLNAPNGQVYKLARAALNNRSGQWAVGALVSGELTLSKHAVALVIDKRAVQQMEGEQVVFIRNEEGFEKRAVTLGQSDSLVSEVLSGIEAGEIYAVDNSFLLKADLEKSSAGHVH
ncbi:efflux RND transporter periplasmic adaptor subunit [Shewanella schlegeliana]|uniref:Efflux RND transporter periplasmic adaptor subunit n=1 Tax=Shewanella schlegeliana TaxID=190308 RepID=A0ABS1T3X4_9GAMM|nr:HlyD family efflux transporter periplasmic adaptor subunit [Shewanella schlegeliana]MBL4915488.1 efflux RND transporter periplasmic adaptor subunit [Shewanella schlegeliana]MCL1111801.1 efflux RND transporter periplasmic adaptor subunit [Shewanella schlegeliana]GIU36583.1 hypothetical protein TUM4433_35570 [Shewanella schlegeliana]